MHIGTSNTNSSYTLGGHKLETTDTERDLGVIISNNLKTIKQCIEVEKKCNHLLGYIKRCFRYKKRDSYYTNIYNYT